MTGTGASRVEAEPPDGFASGWRYTVPVLDMPPYLAYLEKRLGQAGVVVETTRFASLDDAATQAAAVVNCAGFGARWLVPDDTVRPVRGQLVAVRNPGIEEFFAEHTDEVCDLTYLLPPGDRIVLGGSVEEGRADRVADPAIAEGILERCARVEPAPCRFCTTMRAMPSSMRSGLVMSTLLTRPGNAVHMDSPTYHLPLRILADRDVELVAAPTDEHGIDPSATHELLGRLAALGRRVPLLSLVPTSGNPTGASLPAARRAGLVECRARCRRHHPMMRSR